MKILDQNLQLSSQTQFHQRSELSQGSEKYLGGQLVSRQGEHALTQTSNVQTHSVGANGSRDFQSSHQSKLADKFAESYSPTQNSNRVVWFSNSLEGAWNRFVAPNLQTQNVDQQTTPMPEHLLKMVEVIENMMERLTGQSYRLQIYGYERGEPEQSRGESSFRTFDGRSLFVQTGKVGQANFEGVDGERIYRNSQYLEQEKMNFAASGQVSTEDGRQISFDFSSSVSREFQTQASFEMSKGLVVTDPLVVNFGGQNAQLTLDKIDFDLDSDGEKDSINFVKEGSGFLALDKNGNGIIDNGSELFGPESGNGFQDLAAYDEDGNGWIDENDSVFAQLKLWHQDSNGLQHLDGLLELNVGAIALQNVESEFTYKDDQNNAQAQIRASSVFLKEDGGVGSVQQIDLVI
ncbi:hypothetical protein [Thiomicrorhabdus indica]|uniref:hypothetical protein n=1 Tax=Thiomicrorhabdus indica TaxID=2267253 RepID=UPI00102D9101|nr:hypothetical protein [Thiomicrorhabdus indica]